MFINLVWVSWLTLQRKATISWSLLACKFSQQNKRSNIGINMTLTTSILSVYNFSMLGILPCQCKLRSITWRKRKTTTAIRSQDLITANVDHFLLKKSRARKQNNNPHSAWEHKMNMPCIEMETGTNWGSFIIPICNPGRVSRVALIDGARQILS